MGFSDTFKSILKNPSSRGDLSSSLGYLFGDNPFSSASEYLDQMPEALKGYDQFIGNANDIYPTLKNFTKGGYSAFDNSGDIFKKLSDPNFQNFLSSFYKKSPGYDFEKNEGLDAIGRASAASGMVGTPSDQYKRGEWATQFANKDFNQYMDRLFNTLLQSAHGQAMLANLGSNIGSQIYGLGQQSADQKATSWMNMLKTQAENAAGGAGYDDSGLGGLFSTGLEIASLF